MSSHTPSVETPSVNFSEMTADVPSPDQLEPIYAKLAHDICRTETCQAAIGQWDDLRRQHDTWINLVEVHFNQDTSNAEYIQARELSDKLKPKLTELDNRVKRAVLSSSQRSELEQILGRQALALWETDLRSFDPVIEKDLVRESQLEAEYSQLTASAQLDYDGKTYNLSEFSKFAEHPDRQVRYETSRIRWQWFANNRSRLDEIYDQLVRLRDGMAKQLGMEDFVELAYLRLHRTDYNRDDVQRYRDAIRKHLVPLAEELRARQALRLGVQPLMDWDEAIADPTGNPAPQGNHDWMIEQAKDMFTEMGHGLGEFFQLMVDRDLLDLKIRPRKAGGGFCTSLASFRVPFIFANFNGTKGDVEVFTHEVGHAFQNYMSRDKQCVDYLWPTYEACEIHSMGLEFLTWPHMEKFFGDQAEAFRQIHLQQSLLFLPYGVAVDHFQHMVYQQPTASADERFAMWQEVERMYLPWRLYGDLPHVSKGGRWQLQRHIYLAPFYYIDYTLAQACALQFWLRSRRDMATAMQDYVTLCQRGGEVPFLDLVASAKLVSPFQADCLPQIVTEARKVLT